LKRSDDLENPDLYESIMDLKSSCGSGQRVLGPCKVGNKGKKSSE